MAQYTKLKQSQTQPSTIINHSLKTTVYDKDEKEILGYVSKDATSWKSETIFGYVIDRAETQDAAIDTLQQKGSTFLKGVWQYYDQDDHDWFSCIIKDAADLQVTVVRTNFMGYQNPDDYKLVILKKPDENTLIKSS